MQQSRKNQDFKHRRSQTQGIALVFVVSMIVVLSVLFADLSEETTTSYVSATTSRDAYQAELLASSMLDITRLLMALEPQIRPLVNAWGGSASAAVGAATGAAGSPSSNASGPQIPMWKYAQLIVEPLCKRPIDSDDDYAAKWDGECAVSGVAENSKQSVSFGMTGGTAQTKTELGRFLYQLMDGIQNPSVYDPLFQRTDRDGNFTNRFNVISAVIDWWDVDQVRDNFDATTTQVSQAGGEDDIYSRLDNSYRIKNAPFDSVEELRLIRGFGEDFWVNFVEPSSDSPGARTLTIYPTGSPQSGGAPQLNVNDATPGMLITALCTTSPTLPICPAVNLGQAQLFNSTLTGLYGLAAMYDIPLFGSTNDFLDFVEGRGPLYSNAQFFLPQGTQIFAPVSIPSADKTLLQSRLTVEAKLISLQSEVSIHNARTRIDAVVNFDQQAWTPPTGISATVPSMGIFYYYRIR